MMMFRHTHNVLLAVLAVAAAISSQYVVVHAGDGTTCLVTTICDGNEPQLADCTNDSGSTFQACCPPNMLTGGYSATGTGFTCLAFGAAPPPAEVPQAAAAAVPAATPAVVATVPAATVPVPEPAPIPAGTSVVADTTPAAVVPDPAEPAVSEPEATPNSGDCNLSNDASLNNCLQYGVGSVPYTCNRDASFPNGNSYACCPDDQGLPNNVLLADPSTGTLNACLVTPSDDINNPTDDPTPGPTPNPTPDPTPVPTPEPTNDPTPGPTPDPTPGPTPDPTPGPTPNPTPQPTDDPTPNPTPGPTEPPQDDSDENLVDAPREASGTGTSPTAIAATATLAAAAAAALL